MDGSIDKKPLNAAPDNAAPEGAHAQAPTPAELLRDFENGDLTIEALFAFCFVPRGCLERLRELARLEDWGEREYVLLRYLAVHVRLSIEQGLFSWNGDQVILAAGRLTSTLGMPIYLGLKRNDSSEANPWVLTWVGERPKCVQPPDPPSLGDWPSLNPAHEIIVAVELASAEGVSRLPGLAGASHITRAAALGGAVAWALHRGFAVRQTYGATRSYWVPVYLSSREDLTRAPDAVAVVCPRHSESMIVALLEPHVAYASSRAAADCWEQLPPWLIDAWDGIDGDTPDELDAALERIDG